MIIASTRRRAARAVGGEGWVRGASFVSPIDHLGPFSGLARARPARAVGGEAWVRGASFVSPIDHLGPFSGLARARPARAVGGEAWVHAASFVFPVDLFESSRPPHSFPANLRAVQRLCQP